MIANQQYRLLIRVDVPTHFPFQSGFTPTVIDLTLVSPAMQQYVDSDIWAIDKTRNTGSDHELIWIDVQLAPAADEDYAKGFVWKDVNWELFEQAVQTEVAAVADRIRCLCEDHDEDHEEGNTCAKNLDEAVNMLTKAVHNTMHAVLQRRKPHARAKRWWNEELKNLLRGMNSDRRRAQVSNDEEDRRRFRRSRNECHREIKKQKKKFWNDYLASLTGTEILRINYYFKPKGNRRISHIVENGRRYETWAEKEEILLEELFPSAPPQQDLHRETPDRDLEEGLRHDLLLRSTAKTLRPQDRHNTLIEHEELTPDELENAIFTSSSWKASGPDDIPFAVLKQCCKAIQPSYYKICKRAIQKGYQPTPWRRARAAIIPKPNKTDYTKASSNRPISLLCCMAKGLEKVMAKRLTRWCDTHTILHKTQTGSRTRHSTTDTVMSLIKRIQSGQAKGQCVSSWFMDVKGAFNHVILPRLITTMTKAGFPKQMIAWVSSSMTNRRVALCFDGESEEYHLVELGCPQGSPVSPILFNIYLAPLFFEIDRIILPNSHTILTTSYVDDIQLGVSSPDYAFNVRVSQALKQFRENLGQAKRSQV